VVTGAALPFLAGEGLLFYSATCLVQHLSPTTILHAHVVEVQETGGH
jgi:hypothetical protein